ncbi:MAG TPA: GNAT family N-acetyltransferase [Edaphocola sp.]|nr:GNAT family N-acetyltransferase [Edaphocola sp.]
MKNGGNITVSTDKSLLNVTLIHEFLTGTYWGKGRSVEEVYTTIEHSLCFGLYADSRQVGFARVLSDRVAFAYLLDVFILEKYRGQGLSRILLTEILNFPELKKVRKWLLATKDAHGLYQQFGFRQVDNPGRLMERV